MENRKRKTARVTRNPDLIALLSVCEIHLADLPRESIPQCHQSARGIKIELPFNTLTAPSPRKDKPETQVKQR